MTTVAIRTALLSAFVILGIIPALPATAAAQAAEEAPLPDYLKDRPRC